MRSERDGSDWQAVESALERYFTARESGEAIDVKTACGGDVELAAKVLEVLGEGPDLIVDAAEEAPREQPVSFGDFDIVEEVGRGGMGTVYLALQRSLGREVALKVMDTGPKVMPSARVRMRREAELTALLEHPNIVPVYAVGEVGEVPFIAMKFLPGPTLADARGPWAPEQVARVGRSLASALDAAHLHGVVHRDVKPANILMDGDEPVFVDFGLARADSDPTLTQEGKVAGTLRYMAPERLDATTTALDPRADIYGLGATLYELLSGKEVFGEQNPTALVRSVLVREPEALRLRGRDHDLETVVMRALAKDPRKRFQSAGELAADLDRYLAGEPVTSRRVTAAERLWRQVARYPRVSSAVAAISLVVLLLSGILFVQQRAAAADRTQRLAAARLDLDEHRNVRARDGLALLRQLHGDDREVAELLEVAEREVEIDQLLLLAADHADNLRSADVQALIDAPVEPGDARTPVGGLAAVVALGQRGDRAEALSRLAKLPGELRRARVGCAVEAWLEQRELPWQLPAADPERAPDRAMLTALVRRAVGGDAEELLRELRECADPSERPPRHVFLESVLLMDGGRYEQAEGLLRGLAAQDVLPAIWRWLAYAQLQMGRVDAAARSLERAEDDQSRLRGFLALQVSALQAGIWSASVADIADSEWIRSLVEKADRSPAEEQFLAEVLGMTDPDQVDASLARFEALAAAATSPIESERLLAAQVKVAGWHLSSSFEGEAVEEHRAFVDSWSSRVARMRHRLSRSIATMWLARSLVRTGRPADLARGLRLFRDTARDWPESARLVIEYCDAVNRLLPVVVEHPTVMRSHALSARRAALGFLQRSERSGTLAPDQLLRAVRYYAFVLTLRVEDCLELASLFPQVESLLPRGLYEQASQDVLRTAELLDRFRGR